MLFNELSVLQGSIWGTKGSAVRGPATVPFGSLLSVTVSNHVRGLSVGLLATLFWGMLLAGLSAGLVSGGKVD